MPQMQITRRQFYTTLAASAIYPVIIEPRWLELTHRTVRLAGLPAPLRLLHMSDLHASYEVPLSTIEHAIGVAVAQKPDLICVTGDFITRGIETDMKPYSEALKRLSATAPAFAIMGNHDGGVWAREVHGIEDHRAVDRLLEDSGIELLHNRSRQFNGLTLVGTGDLWNRELDADRAFRGAGDGPVVWLNHNPDGKDLATHYPWQLMLSGHTHGGQVLLPFLGPHFAPVVDKRYVEGLKPWRDRQIHVSRGVGSVGGVRFACRPEVTLLTLTPPAV